MDDFEALFERLQYNEEISKKFFDVEVGILSVLDYRDLFERLLTQIKEKFEIPYVWITLIEGSDVASQIRKLVSSEIVEQRLNVVSNRVFEALMGSSVVPLLVNEDLGSYYQLFPKNETYLARSLAIAPIRYRREVIGSLNLGDPSPIRYSPGMDTSLLERLAVKLSICLSNVSAHERLRIQAFRDPLTSLLNRRVMETVLAREFSRAGRYQTPLTVVFLDVDDFKAINDRYGHDTGDAVLKYIADCLSAMCRGSDVVARFAGDEFVIILPYTSAERSRRMTERLGRFFKEHPLARGRRSIQISVSTGVASFGDRNTEDPASLLKRADEALYREKERKKGHQLLLSPSER